LSKATSGETDIEISEPVGFTAAFSCCVERFHPFGVPNKAHIFSLDVASLNPGLIAEKAFGLLITLRVR